MKKTLFLLSLGIVNSTIITADLAFRAAAGKMATAPSEEKKKEIAEFLEKSFFNLPTAMQTEQRRNAVKTALGRDLKTPVTGTVGISAEQWAAFEKAAPELTKKLQAIDAKSISDKAKKAEKANLLLELMAKDGGMAGAQAVTAVKGILKNPDNLDTKLAGVIDGTKKLDAVKFTEADIKD